ncbi:Alpha/Beta hydrolase protein [Chiua virens]|nr:Alpha/Beta hydrolase protein [Chiua virens]
MHLQSFPVVSSVITFITAAAFKHVYAASVHGGMADEIPNTRQAVFRSQIHPDTNLRYITNSGVCETTPGVNQYSGYIDVGTNMSMWFWFFEARNSPETAPFTLWLNGGPGCSSMVGLFQENGPCMVNADGNSTYLNPYSWNNVSNMIYIDQPIGTGFSYGTDTVNSTEAAAPFVWKAFQVLFESQAFSKYASREFIFATESYGGHYGPSFITYFNEQNALISSGTIQGEPVVVSALMINNGWYDPLIQNIAYYEFATYAPGYGQLQTDDVLRNISVALYGPNGCIAQEQDCYDAGNSTESNDICSQADNYCVQNIFAPAVGERDSDDLRQQFPASFPPEYYVNYLENPEVMRKIGAESTYGECPNAPASLFSNTGDDARTWLPELSELVNSGLKTLIWGYASVLAMEWYGNQTLHDTPLMNITLDGTTIAAVANVDNFTFAYPAFQPAAALEIFTQVINKEPLHSV